MKHCWFVAAAISATLWAGPADVAAIHSSLPMEGASGSGSVASRAVGDGGSLPDRAWDSLVHNWDKLQKDLKDRGIQLSVRYDGELFGNTSGGLRQGAAYLGNLNLQLTLDTQQLVGWPGAKVFLYGLGIHGGNASNWAGDAQGVSNIAARPQGTFEEAWIQQNLFENRFSVLAGRYDLNSEFYRLQSAGLFFNSSFGIGPEFSQSGREGPSIFPNTAVGGRVTIKPAPSTVFRMAVMDGVPVDRPNGTQEVFAENDGLLIVAEGAYLYRPSASEFTPGDRRFRIGRSSAGPYQGKFALGAWYYTAKFDDLIPKRSDGQAVRQNGSRGFYALADRVIYQDPNNSQRQVALFGQFGIGDPRVNRFAYYTGGGVTVSSLIARRNHDELGFGIAGAHNGSRFLDARRTRGIREERSEISFELTYLAQIASHFAVQPDVQFVRHPNTDPRIRNALVFLLRFEFLF